MTEQMRADKLIIYHNPGCSKSREAVQIIVQNNKNPEVIEYLENPPGKQELGRIINMPGVSAHSLLRTSEQA